MKNVLLIFGGKSYEHDISVITASQIYNKSRFDNINLVPIYVSRENKFFVYKNKKINIKDFSTNKFSENNKLFKEIVFVSGENNKLFQRSLFGLKEYLTVDVAIIACHGGVGENGKLVAYLESFGIACSSGNVDSLGVCMNKFLFKQTMKGLKISVVSGICVKHLDYLNDDYKNKLFLKLRFFQFPIIIKPNNGGSSIGLFIAKNWEELSIMIENAFEFDDEIIIEKYISNCREFNVSVLGYSDDFVVSEVDEPIKGDLVLTFADKYLNGCSGKKSGSKNSMASQTRKFPAEISDDLKTRIQNLATKVFKNLNLCGVVRIDFLYDEKVDKLYVCEVNSVPGSLAYYFYPKNHILTNGLIENLIDVAYKNYQKNIKFKSEYITNILDEN